MKFIKLFLISIVMFSSFAFTNIKDVLSTESIAAISTLEESGYQVDHEILAWLQSGEEITEAISFEKDKTYIIHAVFPDEVKNLNLDIVETNTGKLKKTTFSKTETGVEIMYSSNDKENVELIVTNRRSSKRKTKHPINCIIAYKSIQ